MYSQWWAFSETPSWSYSPVTAPSEALWLLDPPLLLNLQMLKSLRTQPPPSKVSSLNDSSISITLCILQRLTHFYSSHPWNPNFSLTVHLITILMAHSHHKLNISKPTEGTFHDTSEVMSSLTPTLCQHSISCRISLSPHLELAPCYLSISFLGILPLAHST